MAPTALYIEIYDKEGNYIDTITDRDLGVTDVTVGQVLNTSLCINNGITEVSATHGGEPLSHDADVRNSAAGGSDRALLHDVSPEPQAETITGFYLDGTEYKFGGGGASYTAGNGIDITNDEIGLDGTYDEIITHSDMQGPAPDGFHIPLRTEWQAIFDAGVSIGAWSSSNGINLSTYLKLPIAGCRSYSNSNFSLRGSYGSYWSSTPGNANDAYCLYFNTSSVDPQLNYFRSYGRTVRCLKNFPVVPTDSWTKLYGISIESGGIFHNTTDGLISISSDGTNWITIADKNLGATTVYNYGDTLTEANCGKIYQRGNNYAFSGDPNYDVSQISKSSTKVDVTGYGPGNYYNSSTWITVNPRQSSANNGNNLRGGVSQGSWTSQTNWNLVLGDKLYKIVTSTSAPASGTASNIITIVID